MSNYHIDSSGTVPESARIGHFSVLEPDTMLNVEVIVGHHSVIKSGAVVGARTRIGSFSSIGKMVQIGADCQIGDHVTIHAGCQIRDRVRIDDGAVIGKQPMRAVNTAITQEQVMKPAVIGEQCLLGAGIVIYSGCTLGESVLVADLATIREEVEIGAFTIVGRGVAIENKSTIGRYCKLETNAYIAAYSTLEDRVFVAPGVLTSNDNFIGRTEERFKHFKGVTVRRGGRIGVGAVTLPGVEIGSDAVVAAGALMTRDAEDRMIYAGLPARTFRAVPDEQLLERQGWTDEGGRPTSSL